MCNYDIRVCQKGERKVGSKTGELGLNHVDNPDFITPSSLALS